jgi:hypothetical protein
MLMPRWHQEITLPPSANELVVRTEPIDGSGLPLVFTVGIPAENAGLIRAGWRGFQLSDTAEGEVVPPMLQSGTAPLVSPPDEFRRALLPAGLANATVRLRRASLEHDAVLLPSGGEVWVHLDGLYTDIHILVTLLAPSPPATPNVQVVYYKNGRLERFAPTTDPTQGTARFKAWGAENGGWIGILANPELGTLASAVKIEAATRH